MKKMNKSSSYERIFNVLTASHRKNKNSTKILIKLKKEHAFIENRSELYRNRKCVNRKFKNIFLKHIKSFKSLFNIIKFSSHHKV